LVENELRASIEIDHNNVCVKFFNLLAWSYVTGLGVLSWCDVYSSLHFL